MAGNGPKRRKEARPAEILAAALDEFEELGFARATPAGIARRAGIGRATIYLYFDGKDAVFEALLRARLIGPLSELGARPPGPDESAEAMLRDVLRLFYREVVGSRTAVLLRILVAEGHRFPAIVESYHRQVRQVGMSLMAGIVAHGVARGEFAPDASDLDLRALIGPALAAALWEMVFGAIEPLDKEHVMESHLRVLLDGIRAPRS